MTNPLTNTVINTTNTSVIITGLTPGQYYNINITAVNIIGLGPVFMINGNFYWFNDYTKHCNFFSSRDTTNSDTYFIRLVYIHNVVI